MFNKSVYLYCIFLLVSGCQTLPLAQSPFSENTTGILSKTTIVIKNSQLRNYALEGLTGDKNISYSEENKEYQVMGSNILIKGYLSEREYGNYYSEQCEEYQITKNNKDEYILKLDIKTNRETNILGELSALFLYIPQLVGVPEWENVTVTISADLVTKYGRHIKSYSSQGTTKRNIAGVFYGYDISDAIAKSQQESFNEAFVNLIEQINKDKNVKQVIQGIQNELKAEKKAVAELKNITNGKKIYNMSAFEILEKGDIIFFAQSRNPRGGKAGLFAGQNTFNGNLADYYSVVSNFDNEKVFLYGKNDYVDGIGIDGFYKYVGNFSYTTILGVKKTVRAFKKITIRENLIKYIDIFRSKKNCSSI